MACYSDRLELPTSVFVCRHCGNPLGTSTADHFTLLGSAVQISERRVRVRCDKCKRSTLWRPLHEEG